MEPGFQRRSHERMQLRTFDFLFADAEQPRLPGDQRKMVFPAGARVSDQLILLVQPDLSLNIQWGLPNRQCLAVPPVPDKMGLMNDPATTACVRKARIQIILNLRRLEMVVCQNFDVLYQLLVTRYL